MAADMKFRALVQLNGKVTSDDLKRLALFFDEVYVISPTYFTLTEAFLERKKKAGR